MGWNNPPISWKEFEERLSGKRAAEPPEWEFPEPPPLRPEKRTKETPWAELHCHSSFSFLDGASDPAELAREAARLGIETVAITDHDGMYGAAQFAGAAGRYGIQTVFGAELNLELTNPRSGEPDPAGRHLLVLARGSAGYGRLCSAITHAQLSGREKGRPFYDLDMLAESAHGEWVILTGCRKGHVPAALAAGGDGEAELRGLVERFGRENVFVELVDHDMPGDDATADMLWALAHRVGVGVVASNNVHYAAPGRAARLADALASVRARRSLDQMVGWLPSAGTAHLRSGAEMERRLARFPGVLEATVELANACRFDFGVVAPDLPDWPVPEGHSEASWLRKLTWEGARRRYGPREAERTAGAYDQIARELDVIEELKFPGYFLIIHDIVSYCEREKIHCQGRGSAANSAVCYALGITGVDAVRHKLLFERFLSPGRDGPPDIDLDIEHKQREKVIQYVYDKYGRECTAQVANVISYRPKMAMRDAAKALGFSPGQQDAWSKSVDPRDPIGTETEIPAPVVELASQLERLPRHLGIHSGGMVICDRPVGEVCPIEWARMEGRSVLQWDKDDCASAGLVKFDLLGLGMLSALHDCFRLVAEAHGDHYDLQSFPADDTGVYDMICDADTVGVFQIESRAQMATLPRLRPRNFYDLVVEVALIRPGPIQGGSVHPYLRRRKGLEPADIPHPLMREALQRTLGVPLFQEQMMQLAVDCAGFSPQEADQLRQAMGAKRAPERVHELRRRLLDGMTERGIPSAVAEGIYDKILGFSSFGFPESHAQSFAHLVYASCFLKRYYPAAFAAALVRNQPMGFYSPQSILADARRHGVTVRGIDINASDVLATLEELLPPTRPHPHGPIKDQPVIRLGLGSVRDLGDDVAEAIAAGRPYRDLEDLARRTPVSARALEALATAGAFTSLGLSRRQALWAAGALAGAGGSVRRRTTSRQKRQPDPYASTGAPSSVPQGQLHLLPPAQSTRQEPATGPGPDGQAAPGQVTSIGRHRPTEGDGRHPETRRSAEGASGWLARPDSGTAGPSPLPPEKPGRPEKRETGLDTPGLPAVAEGMDDRHEGNHDVAVRAEWLPGVTPGSRAPALPPMTPVEETLADLWATGISHDHPVAHIRPDLLNYGAIAAERLYEWPHDTNVVVGGVVTHRQRPPTAGGIVFMTLEDETGIVNVVCPPQVWERHRALAIDSQALLVNGRLERVDNVTHVRATRLRRLPVPGRVKSRDFR
jgi:error-prone DNA polymerase